MADLLSSSQSLSNLFGRQASQRWAIQGTGRPCAWLDRAGADDDVASGTSLAVGWAHDVTFEYVPRDLPRKNGVIPYDLSLEERARKAPSDDVWAANWFGSAQRTTDGRGLRLLCDS